MHEAAHGRGSLSSVLPGFHALFFEAHRSQSLQVSSFPQYSTCIIDRQVDPYDPKHPNYLGKKWAGNQPGSSQMTSDVILPPPLCSPRHLLQVTELLVPTELRSLSDTWLCRRSCKALHLDLHHLSGVSTVCGVRDKRSSLLALSIAQPCHGKRKDGAVLIRRASDSGAG